MRGARPPHGAPSSARKPEDARAIARAFLEEEATVLGLGPLSELREEGLDTDRFGTTRMSFQHYVGGLRLEGGHALIAVEASGEIRLFMGNLVPVTQALKQAVQQPTLPEARIRAVIRDDTRARGFDPRQVTALKMEKVAIGRAPYVVWIAEPAPVPPVEYTIDAFTGAIVDTRWTFVVD
jgi:Zn-dependent metalloprotease